MVTLCAIVDLMIWKELLFFHKEKTMQLNNERQSQNAEKLYEIILGGGEEISQGY